MIRLILGNNGLTQLAICRMHIHAFSHYKFSNDRSGHKTRSLHMAKGGERRQE